jgi:hypothetical protein
MLVMGTVVVLHSMASSLMAFSDLNACCHFLHFAVGAAQEILAHRHD